MAVNQQNGANPGFENKTFEIVDKLRGHMDASEYKYVVLGLIFLKYISDLFQAKCEELKAKQETEYIGPEDRDEYLAANISWVPSEVRWESARAQAPQPQSLANQVLRKIGGACELYNRLILVVGSAGNGKTGALQEVQAA